jgi:hypothetical protein
MLSAPSLSSSSSLDLLRMDAPSLHVPKGRPVSWKDEASHLLAWQRSPELYALGAIASGVSRAQRARALLLMLRSSWAELSGSERDTVGRVVRVLLSALPADDVLTVMLALRRARANHKHTARAIVRYVTEHPHALGIAETRRRVVRDIVEHAVGRNTARGLVKAPSARGLPHARKNAAALLDVLYGERAPDAAGASLDGSCASRLRRTADAALAYATTHQAYARALGVASDDERDDLPKTITATNRGDVSATLVHMYRGGRTADLEQGLARSVERAASRLPTFDGTIALVLDASTSMRGYGEREYCSIAQSVALALVLARVCPKLRLFLAGGAWASPLDPPTPDGATDLATALIAAAGCDPDVIALVTDGYENQAEGDLADVARALPRVGVAAPVVVCQSKFTFKDDLALRRPAPLLDEIGFWHEEDFTDVLVGLASRAALPLATDFLRRAFEARLSALEKMTPPWISAA